MRDQRSFPWNIAALSGGVLIGVVASRLLPPVMANATGAVRAKFGQDPFRKLEQDHRQIQTMLHQMSAATEESPAQRMKLLLMFKRALGKHAMAEEDVVYPILHDVAGAAHQAKELYDEHAQMKIHLYGLEMALDSPSTWGERVRQLREVIGSHIRDEEDVEFPRLRALLQDRQYASLAGKILREEALVL
jgi:iron-sulfur cluster repair protein YtfE (RIC family)